MPATQKDVASMKELLTSGVHFGHQTRRWNPKMKSYIFGERGGIYIIDLQQTSALLDESYAFLKRTAERGGSVLFVGTKKQCQESIVEQAERVGMPYVSNRWLGGLLTNYATLSKRIKRMHELRQLQEDGSLDLLPTRESMKLRGDLRKLEQNLGGVKGMDRLPAAVFVVDPRKEQIVVKEARKLKIPIVALVDTNCDPDEVDFVIPGNDDAIRSCGLIVRVIADAVAEGRQLLTEAEMKAEAERKAAEEAAIAEAVAAAEAAAAEAAAAEAKAAEEAAKAEPVAAKPEPPKKTEAPRGDDRVKAEAKPEVKAEAKPEAKAEAKPEPRLRPSPPRGRRRPSLRPRSRPRPRRRSRRTRRLASPRRPRSRRRRRSRRLKSPPSRRPRRPTRSRPRSRPTRSPPRRRPRRLTRSRPRSRPTRSPPRQRPRRQRPRWRRRLRPSPPRTSRPRPRTDAQRLTTASPRRT